MYIYLSRILPLLVLPIGLVIELCLLALMLSIKKRRKASRYFLVTALLVLWVASMPWVGNTFLGSLERAYPPVALKNIPVSQCLVVLGGAVDPIAPPRVEVELLDAADRIRKAAQLYHAAKAQLIIVAGGKKPWSPYKKTEAQAIRSLLMEWGVPNRAIVLEDASRNTRENAVYTVVFLNNLKCGRPLLVTSAAHMQRSVGAFRLLGANVFPVPVDVRVIESSGNSPFDFLPDAEALKMTSDAMREWLGQKVYQWRGWN